MVFSHGNGFCKEVWQPIITRLQKETSIIQLPIDVQYRAFDAKFHGDKAANKTMPATDWQK